MFTLNEEQLDRLSHLRVISYAAGATHYYSALYLAYGKKEVSAWHADVIPVVEFCMAQVLLDCEVYFITKGNILSPEQFTALSIHHFAPGNDQKQIALIGVDSISKELQKLLPLSTLASSWYLLDPTIAHFL